MSEIKDKRNNPPAFPCETEYGMNLRDYFAAKVLHAYISNNELFNGLCSVWGDDMKKTEKTVSKMAYGMADAMLKTRQE